MKPALSKVLLIIIILACSLSVSLAVGLQQEGGGGAVAGAAPEGAVVEQALASVVGASSLTDIRELFVRHLKLRGEAVPAGDKPKYWRELRARPELARTTVYGANSPQSQAVLKVVRPALILYGREWDVAVVEQDAPAIGLFRQCILMVSTGLLRLVTDEELLGFAAHELAHECLIEELREADRLASAYAYHLVELKSDLVAAVSCLLMK
jgi:Zn-dependent protease with chaperone function